MTLWLFCLAGFRDGSMLILKLGLWGLVNKQAEVNVSCSSLFSADSSDRRRRERRAWKGSCFGNALIWLTSLCFREWDEISFPELLLKSTSLVRCGWAVTGKLFLHFFIASFPHSTFHTLRLLLWTCHHQHILTAESKYIHTSPRLQNTHRPRHGGKTPSKESIKQTKPDVGCGEILRNDAISWLYLSLCMSFSIYSVNFLYTHQGLKKT